MNSSSHCFSIVVVLVAILCVADLDAQVSVVGRFNESGTVRIIKPGFISIVNDGRVIDCKIQDADEQAIMIGGQPFRVPAEIDVSGTVPARLLEKGMVVHFFGRTNAYGKSDGEISEMTVVNDPDPELMVEFLERPEPGQSARCEVVGRVVNIAKQKFYLQVPDAKWARRGRIAFTMSEDCKLALTDNHLNRVQPGDDVKQLKLLKLSSNDLVAEKIEVEMTAPRDVITRSFHLRLSQEFSHLPDDPVDPREIRSDHFVVYTDLSERQAQILLIKLETMYGLIGSYFGKRPRMPIECYVVADLRKWNGENLHPLGIAKIREPAGVTITATHVPSGQSKAVVYSCDRHAVVQHEAVHAYCAQAFGSTGPTWYSEGMAEMGKYWIPGESAVNIDPVVIEYLTTAEPKKMADIVAAGQITGDSWQAYAWRWALCHLLANNPNYKHRFKRLGANLMSGGSDSFERAFGRYADKISFEYDQFIQNFGNGYRVDLCAWDWSVSAGNIDSNGQTKVDVAATRGWQPTKLEVREGVSYDFVGSGKWKLSPNEDLIKADGYDTGRGKLIGVILSDYQLSEPFELGSSGSFVAPVKGQLFLRCDDDWTELADNEGSVTVHLRRSKKTAED